jgi:hypothetical protein
MVMVVLSKVLTKVLTKVMMATGFAVVAKTDAAEKVAIVS